MMSWYMPILLLASLHGQGGVTSALSMPECRSRRSFLRSTVAIGGWVTLTLAAPVGAVQERNEALCGTGFFTNIWQYKCTDLGDISDEGDAKELSSSEEGVTDSLLSKLAAFGDDEKLSVDRTPKEKGAALTEGEQANKK